jgi:hypothetical protein
MDDSLKSDAQQAKALIREAARESNEDTKPSCPTKLISLDATPFLLY